MFELKKGGVEKNKNKKKGMAPEGPSPYISVTCLACNENSR
jgi:hypothetical protein